MGASITFNDQNTEGWVYHHSTLWMEKNRITMRELITQRVLQEVQRINSEKNEIIFNSLVQPTDAEKSLNGFKFKRKKPVDAKKQIALAVESFEANGFFVLVDDVQVETLDEEFEITDDTNVSFLKLIPLVGG